MGRRGRIHGSTLRVRSLEEKAMTARAMEQHVLPLFTTGSLTVPIAATYPLAEVADAYARFAAGGKLGKVVVVVD
jgi:NADPH:quinone reductase